MGKINVYDKIMTVNQIKDKIANQRTNYYINLHLTDGLGIEFTAC